MYLYLLGAVTMCLKDLQSSYVSSSISDLRHLEKSAVASHLRYLWPSLLSRFSYL